MENKRIQQIRENLKSKATEELIDIWIENNRVEWTDEAFEAVKQILLDRCNILPTQKPAKISEVKPSSGKALNVCGIIFFSIGIVLIIGTVTLYFFTKPQLHLVNEYKEKRVSFLREIGVINEEEPYTPILILSRNKSVMNQMAKEFSMNKRHFEVSRQLALAASKNEEILKRLIESNKEWNEIQLVVRQKWEKQPKYLFSIFCLFSYLSAKRYPDEISSEKYFTRGIIIIFVFLSFGFFFLIRGRITKKKDQNLQQIK